MTTVFAIRTEDALSWYEIDSQLAGIAERAGYKIRPSVGGWRGRWEVWATINDLVGLRTQCEAA